MENKTRMELVTAAEVGSLLDRTSRKLFMNKEILAPLLQLAVPEYAGYTALQVMDMIDADTIRSDQAISDLYIVPRGEEQVELTEKMVCFDVVTAVGRPGNHKNKVMLYFDIELQNDYRPSNPSYPLISRAVYNAARMLSRQLGTLTQETDYSKLQKVYSIWICNDRIPKKLQNTMTCYALEHRDIIGEDKEPAVNYDLLSVIMVRRGEEPGEADIFRYLNAVFSGDLEGVDRYIPVRDNPRIRKEMSEMLTYDMTVAKRNYDKGAKDAREEMKKKIQKKDAELKQKDSELKQKDSELKQRDTELKQKDAEIENLKALVSELQRLGYESK